jgi:hypothetical protein
LLGKGLRRSGRGAVEELRFELGGAPVGEAQVGAGGLQPLIEGPVVGGELAEALFEGGVLGGDPLDGFLGPLGLQVADLAKEFTDAGALGGDLGVGGLERVLGVECPLAPGRLGFVVGVDERLDPPLAGFGYGSGDCGSGLGIVVEEGAGNPGPAGDGSDAGPGLLAAKTGDGVVNAPDGVLGGAAAGRQGGGRAGFRDCVGLHGRASPSALCSWAYSVSWSSPASARSAARKAMFQTRWK